MNKRKYFFRIFTFFKKIKSKAFTWIYYLKYLIFFSCHKNILTVTIDSGFKVKPLTFGSSILSIRFQGKNRIGAHTIVQGSGVITFGKGSFCGERCIFGVNEKITIGEKVLIAPHVTIRDTDHRSAEIDVPIIEQGIETSPVDIGDNVWIGHGAIILKGVKIGAGAIIAAGSVVNKDVGKNTIVGGIPARVLRLRLEEK
jgi:maltose O-acetyltransferase